MAGVALEFGRENCCSSYRYVVNFIPTVLTFDICHPTLTYHQPKIHDMIGVKIKYKQDK